MEVETITDVEPLVVVAAFFGAFGLYLLVFRTSDVTKGVPGWLSGAVLVVCSVGLAVAARRPR